MHWRGLRAAAHLPQLAALLAPLRLRLALRLRAPGLPQRAAWPR